MAGFSSVTGLESVVFADNASFDGTQRGGTLTTNGQLWIGQTALPHVQRGLITSPLGTLTIGYSSPNITIDLAGGGTGIDSFTTDLGGPVLPTAGGVVNVTGTHVFSSGTVPNQLTLDVDATANTFLLGAGNNVAMTEIGPLTNGQVFIGSTGAAPVAANITSSDSSITIANGAGTISLTVTGGTTVGKTITGDSGGTLAPTAGNWNILGRSGSKTSGSGSTLTVNSPPFADQAAGTTVTLNSGSFATNAITLTTPATAGLADGDLVQFVATNGVLVVQMNTGQVGHLGSAATSSGGTFTGSATGDSLSLRWQASTSDWWATSSIGVWVLA